MDPLEEQLAQLSLLNSTYDTRRLTSTSQLHEHISAVKPGTNHSLSPIATHASTGRDIATSPLITQPSNLADNKVSRGEAAVAKSMFSSSPSVSGLVSVKASKKVGPLVPPKPFKKKQNSPEVPQSCVVKQACEPLYSKRLQSVDVDSTKGLKLPGRVPIFQRKLPIYATQNNVYDKANSSKVTLDNPAVLEQQLEALAHHKKQLEKKKLLQQQSSSALISNNISCVPKLSSTSLVNDEPLLRGNDYAAAGVIYSNLRQFAKKPTDVVVTDAMSDISKIGFNKSDGMDYKNSVTSSNVQNNIYSNLLFEKDNLDDLPPPPAPRVLSVAAVDDTTEYLDAANDEDIPPPPSPVSSSYSELRRATDVFSKKPYLSYGMKNDSITGDRECSADVTITAVGGNMDKIKGGAQARQTYMNMNYGNDYNGYSPTLQTISQGSSDFYGYGSCSQGSSTYESIYEPINPRPPSQMSTRSNNYLMYAPYVNGPQLNDSGGSNGSITGGNMSRIDSSMNISGCNTPLYPSAGCADNSINSNVMSMNVNKQKEAEVEALTEFLVHSLDTSVSDMESYGICFKCNERVLGENSGCTAMDQIYHIACFTCSQCQINLQGKPFYALDGKPFCEYDYLQTLEKCSVCMKPILERILRATGKPYHPQCFICIVCNKSLDGIPFTVDATNQNYCIADFHKKFAPRCCVCKEPIMPEPGEEETVRVVALDRSFHFECYKCEDCGLLLSSEAEGRGCYPLDGHVLCKSCNAKRVQMLTNRMTTEL